jgi:hypothetical protein
MSYQVITPLQRNLRKIITKRNKVYSVETTHKHHTIGFETIDKIDWHLKNLWSEGFKTLIDIDAEKHLLLHGEQHKINYKNKKDFFKKCGSKRNNK